MNCHLANTQKPTEQDFKVLQLEVDIVESDKFDLFISRCRDCGQLYLGCFCEINLCDGEDDYWNYWLPISAEEAEAVQADPSKATELLQSRRHLTWHPSGKIYWTDMPDVAVAWGGW